MFAHWEGFPLPGSHFPVQDPIKTRYLLLRPLSNWSGIGSGSRPNISPRSLNLSTNWLCLSHMTILWLWAVVALVGILWLEASVEHRKWGLESLEGKKGYWANKTIDIHSGHQLQPPVTEQWFTKCEQWVPGLPWVLPGGPRDQANFIIMLRHDLPFLLCDTCSGDTEAVEGRTAGAWDKLRQWSLYSRPP